ncbi:hypothetical protein M413DRAFT_140934 [Hebeloma cylindrosporum]|uniref:Uncharacterized protein n=1 Tax=Hebeloma cylindrosporum TaxID=76867 RepID=A0A0C2YLL5_HEBCY|nr:hypothetical protein M413DRAFT_140934 [Hebeloma cylindrosporum h7]
MFYYNAIFSSLFGLLKSRPITCRHRYALSLLDFSLDRIFGSCSLDHAFRQLFVKVMLGIFLFCQHCIEPGKYLGICIHPPVRLERQPHVCFCFPTHSASITSCSNTYRVQYPRFPVDVSRSSQ